jgi:hypothetical protein
MNLLPRLYLGSDARRSATGNTRQLRWTVDLIVLDLPSRVHEKSDTGTNLGQHSTLPCVDITSGPVGDRFETVSDELRMRGETGGAPLPSPVATSLKVRRELVAFRIA